MVDALRHDGHLVSVLKEHHYEAIIDGYKNSVRLMRTFLPQRFDGDILLFVATQGDPKPSPEIWRPYVGGQIKVHRVDCSHETMMDHVPAASDRPYSSDRAQRWTVNQETRCQEEATVTNPFEDENGIFHVLINEEGQYSLWPSFIDVPDGWTIIHKSDSRAACLEFMDRNWTDLRPKSLIKSMQEWPARERKNNH